MGIFCFISKNRQIHSVKKHLQVFFFLFDLYKKYFPLYDFNSEIQQSYYINFIALKPNKNITTKNHVMFLKNILSRRIDTLVSVCKCSL